MGAGDCIFCKIATGQIPARIIEDGSDLLAFRDIDPKAPVHVLIIPRSHIGSLNAVDDSSAGLASRMLLMAKRLAAQEGIAESGYRLVLNTGPDGGQSVDHMHLHLLGGRPLGWPPG